MVWVDVILRIWIHFTQVVHSTHLDWRRTQISLHCWKSRRSRTGGWPCSPCLDFSFRHMSPDRVLSRIWLLTWVILLATTCLQSYKAQQSEHQVCDHSISVKTNKMGVFLVSWWSFWFLRRFVNSAAEGRSAGTERICESTEAQVFKPNVLPKNSILLLLTGFWVLTLFRLNSVGNLLEMLQAAALIKGP